MAKILLVEDDNNLREIYEARLLAEGYDIVSARDGEEALTIAIKEKPDLIISDVMMPKISGFDMLDIRRSTAETKDAKVIMMTALSQAEDKARAEKLGADRYLVKSQVTLEDVARVAKEVLSGETTPTTSQVTPDPTTTDEDDTAPVTTAPVPAPVAEPVQSATPASTSDEPAQPAPAPVAADAPAPVQPAPTTTNDPPTDADEQEAIAKEIEKTLNTSTTASTEAPAAEKPAKKVISPINDVNASASVDLERLAAAEETKDKMSEVAHTVTPTESSTPSSPAPAPEDLQIGQSGEMTPDSPTSTSETPAPVAPSTAPSQPVKPTTGTNIDGVVPPQAATTTTPSSSGVDPSSIAL